MSYLDPDFVGSDEFNTTEREAWSLLRVLRVVLHDTYWKALDDRSVPWRHLSLTGLWKAAHRAYGLAVAVGDFEAIREALSCISLLEHHRDGDPLSIDVLSSQFGRFRADVALPGMEGAEARHVAGPDPLGLPATLTLATRLQAAAEEKLQAGNGDGALYLYRFDAHLVLSRATPEPIPFRVLVDGESPGLSRGVDVDEDGNGLLDDGRMYQLVRVHDSVDRRTVEITFAEPGPRRTPSRSARPARAGPPSPLREAWRCPPCHDADPRTMRRIRFSSDRLYVA